MRLTHNGPALVRSGRLVALTAWASLLATAAAFAWPVGGGGDVAIDNLAFKSLDGDSFAIAHV